jgi:CheY-like chemotaxis protein
MLEFIANQVGISIQRQKNMADLQEALIKAEAGDRLKTAFINNISHEIRTPLNGILGFSEMTLSPDSSPEDNELFFTIIKKSSKRLLNTITSYMDIAMIVSGTMETSSRPAQLSKICEDIRNDFIDICALKGIELQLFTPKTSEPLQMNTDQEKVRKIITHLLDNASKFTQKGYIHFGFQINEQDVEFYVKDTGTGIKAEAFNTIFEAFMQGDVSSTRGYEGSGLGLTIANGMVKLLGGKLWVESERGKGSTFYFTLPFAQNPVVLQRKPVETPVDQKIKKPVVLIAEDDDSNYKYIEIVLLYAEYEVLRAENGIDAVDLCRTNNDIRLVLMDIKMPLMDGFEATRQIRAFKPQLPVVALTAHVTTEDENAAIAAGCTEYVTKPVTKTRLLEIIDNLLILNP